MLLLRACACALAPVAIVLASADTLATPLSLSVAAARRSTEVGTEWRATVSLVVPLDRVFGAPKPRGPGRSAEPVAQNDELPAEAPSEDSESGEDDRTDPEDKSEPARAPRAAPVRPILTATTARRVVREALRVAGYSSSRRRLESLARRAKSSALLPELRLAGGRSADQTLRLTPSAADPYGYTQAGGSDLWAEARLIWRLDRLVFADDEIAVARLSGQRIESELRFATRVLKTLFEWQRARARAADPLLLPEQKLSYELDQMEAEAALDVLTSGWFSAWLEQAGRGSRQ